MKILHVRSLMIMLGLLAVALPVACSSQTLKDAPAVFEATSSRPVNSGDESTRAAAPEAPQAQATAQDTVTAGDLVTVHYTMKLENGEVFYTTRQETAEDPEVAKATWFQPAPVFGPEEILAGDEPTRQELALEVVGMHKGEDKTVTMPPEKGFGPVDPKKIVRFSSTRTISVHAVVKAADYMARMKSLPVAGREINWAPYFKSRITRVDEQVVEMEALAQGTTKYPADYGLTTVAVEGDEVHITLEPRLGALFQVKGRQGRITAVDQDGFSVDFNHPAAGQSIVMEIAVQDIEKADAGQDRQVPWITQYDEGVASAAAEHKPMVMVLYADWCGWCKKLLTRTVVDPRVQRFRDDFVWAKVNSDQQQEYKEKYGQKSFPLVIMTDDKGEVINRVEGFRDARAFVQELQKALAAIAGKQEKG